MTRHRWATKIPNAADSVREAKYRDPTHRRTRAALAPLVAAGLPCWRCGQTITGEWHVGHDDTHLDVIRGAEHAACNRTAAARKGSAIARANRVRAQFTRPTR